MFEWSRGSSLKAMMNAGIPGVEADDWLEGFMFGFMQSRFKLNPPLDVLDVSILDATREDVERPYRAVWEQQGAKISVIEDAVLSDRNFPQQHTQRYDLVSLLSMEREACLRPMDLEKPLVFLDRLLTAANLLKPGGALIWSYLYCFSTSPDDVHSFLEPAAVYQAIRRRNFRPFTTDYIGVDRITILNSSDTLFVRHKSLLEVADRSERVIRAIAGVSRPGANCRVEYIPL